MVVFEGDEPDEEGEEPREGDHAQDAEVVQLLVQVGQVHLDQVLEYPCSTRVPGRRSERSFTTGLQLLYH